MAIATNDAIDKFGTQTTVVASGSALADTIVSASSEGTLTNTDDVREAAAVFTGTFAGAPAANSTVDLYLQPLDIDGTNDAPAPASTYLNVYAGSFPLSSATTQSVPIDIPLPNTKSGQTYGIFVQNAAGQALNSGWTLKVTPKAIGPKA